MATQGKIPYHLWHFLSWLRRDQRSKDTLEQWRLSSCWTQGTRLRGHPFLTERPFPVCACVPAKSSHPLPVTPSHSLGRNALSKCTSPWSKLSTQVSLLWAWPSSLPANTKSIFFPPPKAHSWHGFIFSIYSFFQTTFLPMFPLRRKRKKLNF